MAGARGARGRTRSLVRSRREQALDFSPPGSHRFPETGPPFALTPQPQPPQRRVHTESTPPLLGQLPISLLRIPQNLVCWSPNKHSTREGPRRHLIRTLLLILLPSTFDVSPLRFAGIAGGGGHPPCRHHSPARSQAHRTQSSKCVKSMPPSTTSVLRRNSQPKHLQHNEKHKKRNDRHTPPPAAM